MPENPAANARVTAGDVASNGREALRGQRGIGDTGVRTGAAQLQPGDLSRVLP